MFKTLSKKITAGITAAAIGLSITFTAPVPAEAISWGDVISVTISAAAARQQVKKQIANFNNTESGRLNLLSQFQKEYGVNEDPTLNARLDRIMSNLTVAVGKVDPSIYEKPYKYFVSADKTLNAACSLGHVMMVNTGAFDYLSTDDEIAAIVGHEMGHGQKDHVAKGNEKNITKAALAQLGVIAAGGGTLANVVGSVVLNNSVAHGSKKHETEADNLAWEYILNTDYNIGACAAVMQRLSDLYGGKAQNKIAAVLAQSDHPNTDSRRDNYAKKLYEYSGKHASAKDGVITINGKKFTTVAKTTNMSSAERSFFVLGNLAKAYHNGKNKSKATVRNGSIYLDDQLIMSPASGDEDIYILVDRLNEIK